MGQHRLAQVSGGDLARDPARRPLSLLGPIRERLGDFEQVYPHLDDLLGRQGGGRFFGAEHADRRRRDITDDAGLLERLPRGAFGKAEMPGNASLWNAPFLRPLLADQEHERLAVGLAAKGEDAGFDQGGMARRSRRRRLARPRQFIRERSRARLGEEAAPFAPFFTLPGFPFGHTRPLPQAAELRPLDHLGHTGAPATNLFASSYQPSSPETIRCREKS